MKIILALTLALVLSLSLFVGCGSKETTTDEPTTNPSTSETSTPAVSEDQQVAGKDVSNDENATYKKDIVIAHHQANVSVGPQDSKTGMQTIMELLQFNRLTKFDPDAKELKGELAESFEATEGGKIWTFNLKKGILFQNGEELKADDVVYTWERAKELGTVTSAWADCVESVEAVDEYTVQFNLSVASMDFGFQLSQVTASILNRKANEDDPENGYGIGTGGWKIREFVANDYTLYERFDDSFVWSEDGVNPTETIKVVYMADQNTRMIGVQSGDLDIGCIANNSEYDNYKAKDGVDPVIVASWSCDYVGMCANCEYFQDENVRKAVAYAINKDEALEIINNGFGLTCDSYWCPDAPGYTDTFEENYSYNLEKAKEYLAQSAYPDGFTCKLTTITAYSLYAEVVQAQLAQIGINCEVDLTDSPGMSEGGANGTFEMYIWNTTMSPYGDFLNKYITTGGVSNFAHFSNETIDQLMNEAISEQDGEKRAELYEQVQEELHDDCYIVPMFFGYLSSLVGENVEGYQFTSEGYYFYNVRALEK